MVKLPNIGASIPQLVDAIKELQSKGFNIPDFPSDPQTEEEKEIRTTCQGARLCRKPSTTRRKFRPPGSQTGQGICSEKPTLHGRVVK